jgi:ATPases involved in chromosome partitioning
MTPDTPAKTSAQNSECSGSCDSCSSAQKTPRPKGLPPKVKVNINHVILVLSGKGGVGKSTVAVNLATAFANRGKKTGLLDLDIHGPSIPKMLGIEKERPAVLAKCIQPVMVTPNLAVMSMAFLLPDTSTPVVWRGPMKMGAIQQFLAEVNWGALDYLVVDLPPGTGDEVLSIAQLAPNVRGAVIVTTPQDVAVLDATKAIAFIKKMDLPVIGVVENMSGMVCPHCHEVLDLFGKGGGKKAAEKFAVPYLGAIPLDPAMVASGDAGKPFINADPESPTAKAVETVMENVLAAIEQDSRPSA